MIITFWLLKKAGELFQQLVHLFVLVASISWIIRCTISLSSFGCCHAFHQALEHIHKVFIAHWVLSTFSTSFSEARKELRKRILWLLLLLVLLSICIWRWIYLILFILLFLSNSIKLFEHFTKFTMYLIIFRLWLCVLRLRWLRVIHLRFVYFWLYLFFLTIMVLKGISFFSDWF